ncbi:hypothetical protein Trichorick_00911 [Candidatus Trichorickettsia mobilis]|uniref:Heme exporter protein B n=1 Tax=Candidatus Trichorickettsia mobilis TaxID=1346319 RepID=A0ABZ0UTP6_9RICK|nr:heme exporter protein CcmB [Candidatus Trichorickettsia mobilis]WPY01018.1 hypothetical protein Trichorick_00911 [Candidatus Trichorickettsia mobilis]
MQKLVPLLRQELIIQYKINNLIKYLIAFFIFSALSIVLINKQEEINKFGILFSVIYIPLSFIGFANIIFKQDIEDGTLELLLSSFSAVEIVVAKFGAILISSTIGAIINMPIILIIFNLTRSTLIKLSITLILLLILASALLVLIAAMQGYFRSNTNFLSILIMPLIIPNIIMAGLILQEETNFYLLTIMTGIDLIVVPCTIFLSSYLIKNVYNI